MSRRLLIVAIATFTLSVFSPRGRADDEKEATFKGKTAKEWVAILDKDKDPKHRRAALIALEKFGPKERLVVQAAASALKKDTDDQVRFNAARVLGRMIPPAVQEEFDVRDAINTLAEALGTDKKDKVREACASALGVIGTEPKEKEPPLPPALVKALKPTVPVLAAALKDKHAGTAAAAAESLGRMGQAARAAAPVLLETLKDKKADRFARTFSAIALVRIGGTEVAEAVPALIDTLADDKAPTPIRETAARLLGQLGKDASRAVPTLAKALTAKEIEIRRAAAGALAQMGEGVKGVLPELEKAVKDKDKTVRVNVIFAIGGLGKDAAHAVAVLIPCLKENQIEVRLAAIRALGNIGPDAKDAVKLLLDARREGQADIRDAAKDALDKIQKTEKP
jgi:HEAT repeat protein